VGGFTFVWEQVTVGAAAGIQRVVLDMEQGVGQLVDNVYFAGTHAPPPGFRLSSVSTGNYFTCGLDPKGRAWCWGSDDGGFLGNDTLIAGSLKPVLVTGGGRFTELDAGADFTCALRSGQPWCWGGNAWSQIGAPAFTTCVLNGVTLPCNPTPAAVPAKGFVTITAGSLHACTLDGAGQAFCWGWNPNGELGHTSTATCTLATQTVPCSKVPTAVTPGPAGPLSFVAISAGAQHTCALDKGVLLGGELCGRVRQRFLQRTAYESRAWPQAAFLRDQRGQRLHLRSGERHQRALLLGAERFRAAGRRHHQCEPHAGAGGRWEVQAQL
jgi:alpha-tubulin suppressor-like RCC1 family protein